MIFSINKCKKKIFITITLIVLILTIIVGSCAVYVGDYYRADHNAIDAFLPLNSVSIETSDNGTMVFKPQNASTGFIFYPGGKVEYSAYQPLMAACAQQGILCILVKMPFNLAVLDINISRLGIIDNVSFQNIDFC